MTCDDIGWSYYVLRQEDASRGRCQKLVVCWGRWVPKERMAEMGPEVQVTAVTPRLREAPGEWTFSCFLKAEPRDDFSDVTEA